MYEKGSELKKIQKKLQLFKGDSAQAANFKFLQFNLIYRTNCWLRKLCHFLRKFDLKTHYFPNLGFNK